MEENKEILNSEIVNNETVNSEIEDISDENFDDSEEYIKAKTFPIDESWPEEIKKQVEQLNAMSAMINEDPVIEDEGDSESEEDVDSDEDTSSEEEQVVQNVSTEETETFGDVF